MDYRTLQPGQSSEIYVASVPSGESELVYRSHELLLEAPNWTADGGSLVLNGHGKLWRLDLDSHHLTEIPLSGVPALNNDHVLSPDGKTIFLSANDGHIYQAPLEGGHAVRISHDGPRPWHFLHGVSPDGRTLAYVGFEPIDDEVGFRSDIYTFVPGTEGDTQLTDGTALSDGSEYSPDGEWIYFNTEQFSHTPGHAQIARMRPDGGELTQLTSDNEVNWFPHWAPDGKTVVYLAFPAGTLGHPVDKIVRLKTVRDDEWKTPTTVVELPGGQGTINVNSWAPTSDRFAYVAYPIVDGLGRRSDS